MPGRWQTANLHLKRWAQNFAMLAEWQQQIDRAETTRRPCDDCVATVQRRMRPDGLSSYHSPVLDWQSWCEAQSDSCEDDFYELVDRIL